jgi:hypothetical protein
MREYFSHDHNARNDRKMVRLAMAYGMQGIGIYWCVVEMLYEEQGKIMLSDCERIAFELRVDCNIVDSVITNFGLFEYDENYFWSASVDRRIEAQIQVSQGAKKAAEQRWQKYRNQQDTPVDAGAMRTHTERNARKEKESKVKESKSKSISIAPLSKDQFCDLINQHGGAKYPATLLADFFNYWSEANQKGKMRWQLERTFEIPNRLATWARNQNKWGNGNQSAKNTLQAAKDNLATALDIIYNTEQ